MEPITELKKSPSIASTKSLSSVHSGVYPNIFDLPHEMVLVIFSKLEPNTILKLRTVCQEWKSLADSDQIWRSLFHWRMISFRKNYEAPSLKVRESSGSSADFLRNHADDDDSDAEDDHQDKSPFESWKSYYYRKMIALYPSRFKAKPQSHSSKKKEQARSHNTSAFLLYLIAHIFVLLFTVSTVFKVAGIFKGTYWSYSIFLSLAVVLFGNACDYKFLWVPEYRVPWTKVMKTQ